MKASRNHGSRSCANWIRRVHEEVRLDCMGGFVVTTVYGFSRPTGDLDVLEIARNAGGAASQEIQDLS
jgi:hypothetical protein